MAPSPAPPADPPAAAPRNLVLCCDGTANEFADDHTSVVKLAGAMVKDAARQQVVYHPGIGTRDPLGSGRIGGFFGRVAGLAFGYDLQRDIADAYTALMNHYRAGDRLFLFGFSRGAYTARAVAALLRLYGLVMPGNEALVPYAVKMLWQGARIGTDHGRRDRFFADAAAFRATLSAVDCAPHFVGVWDTVSSVGWVRNPVTLPHTRTNAAIAVFRHAVSIDEHRAFFRSNLFVGAPTQDVEEVWFPGVHCDVGGGYAESESGLSKYPLAWLAREAAAAGLMIDAGRLALVLGDPASGGYAPPSPAARRHRSLKGAWIAAEFVPKRHRRLDPDTGAWHEGWRMNLFRRRRMPPGAKVHEVAWRIGGGYERRLPADAVRVD